VELLDQICLTGYRRRGVFSPLNSRNSASKSTPPQGINVADETGTVSPFRPGKEKKLSTKRSKELNGNTPDCRDGNHRLTGRAGASPRHCLRIIGGITVERPRQQQNIENYLASRREPGVLLPTVKCKGKSFWQTICSAMEISITGGIRPVSSYTPRPRTDRFNRETGRDQGLNGEIRKSSMAQTSPLERNLRQRFLKAIFSKGK